MSLSIGLPGTNFNEIWIGNLSFPFKKMHLKMSSARMAAILSGVDELTCGYKMKQYKQTTRPWGVISGVGMRRAGRQKHDTNPSLIQLYLTSLVGCLIVWLHVTLLLDVCVDDWIGNLGDKYFATIWTIYREIYHLTIIFQKHYISHSGIFVYLQPAQVSTLPKWYRLLQPCFDDKW